MQWLEDYIVVEKLYCREGGLRVVCVAIHLLYCDWGVSLAGIVLQYNILYCDSRGAQATSRGAQATSRGAQATSRGAQAGHRGVQAGRAGRWERGGLGHRALGTWGARRGELGASSGCRRTAWAHLGMQAGLWAVHLVHSACF